MKELRKGQHWERKLLLISAVLLMATFFAAFTKSPILGISKIFKAYSQTASVSVKPQPNSPLSIELIDPNRPIGHTPEVQVIVANMGTKPISAYAIRYDTSDDGSKSGGLELSNKALLNFVLQPGQSEIVNVGEGTYESEIKVIRLSVDFIEFIDGTRWGPDTYNSGERLNGLRAGAIAATSYLLKVLQKTGAEAVMKIAEGETINILPPSDHSQEWLEGFRQGIEIIKGHLRQSYTNRSLTEIESILQKPIDALESRRRQ